MTLYRILILCTLFTQLLCAPSGCIESCTYHQTQSYQTQQASNFKFDNHANVQDIDNLNLNYNKPGNWTEQNVYRTDGGHGKVYEERGQYVQGSKRMRYFKKNYTSHVDSPTLIEHERLTSSLANYNSMPIGDSRQTLEHSKSSASWAKETHDQQHEQTYNQRAEHLSNSNENSQILQRGLVNIGAQNLHEQNRYVETKPGNWSKVDEYKTDDGHGRVFKEEGQYVTDTGKVRYYRKNYTSSYTTGNVPKTNINLNHAYDLEREMQRLQQELNIHQREIHETLQQPSGNIFHVTNLVHDTVTPRFANEHLQVAENINGEHDYEENQFNTQTHSRTSNTRNMYPIHNVEKEHVYRESQSTHSLQGGLHNYPQYRSPNYDSVSTDHNSNHQNRWNNRQETSQHMQSEKYYRQYPNINQAELIPNQGSNSNLQQNIATYPQTSGYAKHYEENWSSSQVPSPNSNYYKTHQYESSHSSHQTVQSHNAEANQLGRRYNSKYRTELGQLVTGVVDLGQGTQYADCSQGTEEMQYNIRGKRSAKYNEFDDMLQNSQSKDRLDQIHYYPPELSYNNKELPSFHETGSDLTQQSSRQFGYNQEKPKSHNQHYEDLTQKDTDLQQQTSGFDDFNSHIWGKLELGSQMQQSTQSNEELTQQTNQYDDFIQQNARQLQYNHQIQWPRYKPKQSTISNAPFEGLTQQNEDLTQQNEQFTQQNEDLTQQNKQFTQQNEDLTQQNEQFTQRNEDLTQQNEDLTQQNEQFTQQNEDLTQQNEDLTQQNEQFTQRNEDLTQQNEDLIQQTNTFDNHAPQTLEQLLNKPKQDKYTNQDTISSIRRDSIPHTRNNDFSQQKPKTFEYGSQMQPLHTPKQLEANNQHSKWLGQENTEFTQQTGGFEDFEQVSANLEHTQQTQYPTYGTNNQHLEDLTQQTGQFDDLISEKPKYREQMQQQHEPRIPVSYYKENQTLISQGGSFSQQTGDINQQHFEKPKYKQQIEQLISKPERSETDTQYFVDLAQHNEGITQQTSKFNDDFIGKSSEKLTSEQQTQLHNLNKHDISNEKLENLSQQNEDFTQQTHKFDDSQQVLGKLEFGQKNEGGIQQIETLNSFTQQTPRKSEYGQETQELLHPPHNPASINTFEDLTQQTNEPNGLIHTDTNSDRLQTPAPKPKLKARYQRPNFSYNNQEIIDSDKRNTNIDIDNNKSEKIQRGDQGINTYNSEQYNLTNANQLTQTNKRDDNINVQWRPSSKDSLESQVHQSHTYPSVNSNLESQYTQQSQHEQELNLQNQKFRSQIENGESNRAGHLTEEQTNNYNQNTGFVKGRRRWHHFNRRLDHTRHIDSSSDNSYDLHTRFVQTTEIPTFNQDFQQQQWNVQQAQKDNANIETKLEPRILEAYGAGPYDINHSDDIFDKVTPKPDALLPPYLNMDSWDIREKEEKVLPLPEITETVETTTVTETPPNFWGRIGHKITNTFGKAREKAKEIFG